MKTKSFVLGFVAIVFAVTGSIASILVDSPAYVWGTTEENTSNHCIFVGNKCNDLGTAVCSLSVVTTLQGTVIPTQVFKESQCTNLIKGDRATRSAAPTETIKTIVIK